VAATVAATATQRLESIALWSKLTAITTLVGVVVIMFGITFAVLEYVKRKNAVNSAADELTKARAEFVGKLKAKKH
jgi:hypothetical protein